MKFIFASIFSVLSFVSLIAGAPVYLSERDVFVPPVLQPNHESVWKVGTTQTVTWDVRNPPKQITNTNAMIVLVTDGLLDMEHPLATGISVLRGTAQVVVPKVAPGKNYQILVFGDSGNTGEFFEIVN